ncbi:hypothetical protein F4818DRAFT_328544 [Hypoxylon cercidicola]|nr:hypothetical protein F4818DRAFT_328544 [Hypoxylon cercidicola]
MQTPDLLASAASLSPAAYCQLFYVTAAATVLTIAAAPESIQDLLTQYGARSAAEGTPEEKRGKITGDGLLTKAVGWVTSVGKIPHSWFKHFYILSLSCSVFWAIQFLCHGAILDAIVRNQASREPASMSIDQVILMWFLMGLQGARRLYEYMFVLRPSSSKMWIIHWLLGMAFYSFTSVSIWVEGSSMYRGALLYILLTSYVDSIHSADRRTFAAATLSFNIIFGVLAFLVSWSMQYRCHSYLSGLKKYSLPEKGLFKYIVCPHYMCECALYLSLALVAAPRGRLYNRTLICALLFVTVNLGVTANGTKKWYTEKFGREMVQGKWRMIPLVF